MYQWKSKVCTYDPPWKPSHLSAACQHICKQKNWLRGSGPTSLPILHIFPHHVSVFSWKEETHNKKTTENLGLYFINLSHFKLKDTKFLCDRFKSIERCNFVNNRRYLRDFLVLSRIETFNISLCLFASFSLYVFLSTFYWVLLSSCCGVPWLSWLVVYVCAFVY